jgi:hypothetical protein
VGDLATFREYREDGALVGLAPDSRTDHECGDSRYLAIPFLDACMAQRLPEKGSPDQTMKPMEAGRAWLAPVFGEDAVPAADYRGDPKESVWLPDEFVARAWEDYVKTVAVGDTTPPPAPFLVRASYRGGQGAAITRHADADIESGIGGFLVLRDGEALAKVPQAPVGKFGRPLFQGLTYHDTPAQPLPEMRHLDTSAGPGGRHAYRVVTVNGVGLTSEPSPEVSIEN